ncbi:MAG TPA: GGDEF domain-containing protein [Phycisphaerae bacterium]|nr:GGDEF domain-containing protein [Phycisphaerae bacterium]
MPHQATILAVVPANEKPEDLVRRLEGFGAAVHTASDCLSAMGLVKSEDLDVIVVTSCPGQFDLADTARVLKSIRTDRFIPVMAVLDRDVPPERRQAVLDAGVDEVVHSDTDDETLHYRLHAALRLKGAYDQLHQVRDDLDKTLARETALLKQLREDNRALKVRSITDGLTALYNYRYLMEWMKTEFKISRRYGHELSMIIVDLDHFKTINDRHGHPFGDYVLKEVAVTLKRCARESDLVARYAGDEFALICPRTGHKEVQALAKRILAACRKHRFVAGEDRVPITLSLGAATYPEDPEVVSPELLVFLADQALYHSKRQGRNATTSWHEIDPETRVAIRRELRGPDNPLLADDPKSRLELAAAARLVGTGTEPTSLRAHRTEPKAEP